jgi:adenosylcobinamide-GDP ribazoletransferase
MRALRLAISFLTIFPVYGRRVADEKEMAASLYFYPVTGLLLGGILAGAAWAGSRLHLAHAGDVVTVVLWIILTGGLHLDGLMDTADGLFSGRDRERKLEIMKDSRTGAMGVLALAALLLLKVSFLGLLPYPVKYWVLVLTPALGRSMMLLPIAYYPYARQGAGLGRAFGDQASRLAFPAALILLVAVAWLAPGQVLGIELLITALLGGLITRSVAGALGGHTGDTFGAICEVSETLFLMIAATGLRL